MTSTPGFTYRFRPPHGRPEDLGGRAPEYRRTEEGGVLIERDLPVQLRDGTTIFIDLFRPADGTPAAPLIAWGPYGKHGHTRMAVSFPKSGVKEESMSPHTVFEAPDPIYWVPRGYAVINPDPRGTWFSEGRATYLSPDEALDFYDLIEWAGTRDWSNGKVGLSGVSYLTSSQWHVAALNPPHLAAINPWEGWSDFYREVVRHGGIPETHFWGYLPTRWGRSTTEVEDLPLETRERPFFDEYWASKRAEMSRITVPAFVVASWTDQGLHTRGTLEGFKQIASAEKWLEVHGRKKWAYYYEPESMVRQTQFFDRYLHGRNSGLENWPRVRLEARERFTVGRVREAAKWPVPGTQYVPLFLDTESGRLEREPVPREGSLRYDPLGEDGPGSRAVFTHRFEEAVDLIGHMKLRLWVSAEGADDMDLFVAVQKLDAAGEVVPFAFYGQFEDGPVALGWLRVSHRELDEARSTPFQPVLLHQREIKLAPGEVVPVDIEIWPSGTHFEAGTSLRLVVQGRDVTRYPLPNVQPLHESTVNAGTHVLHAGGAHDSHLLIPVLPAQPGPAREWTP
ncbi:CocE/NonD family hydrolase [Roseomonas sp. BN140053]|uniref:CocE/NonD family hydrolase n=1 Tax=Roseomonas sp. BN140053 TaxID=3391898 RepID=UPI0039ED89D1